MVTAKNYTRKNLKKKKSEDYIINQKYKDA